MRTMRNPVTLAIFFALVAASSARGQEVAKDAQACVDIQIGNDRSTKLNCLNEALQHEVEREKAAPRPEAPIDAHSESNQVGTFNEAAAREHMGNAYGVSSVPQRPKSVFVSPIVGGSH